MNLLLDTHIFLWSIDDRPSLSQKLRREIKNPENRVFLSIASVWECVIKYQLNKPEFNIYFPESPDIYLPQKRRESLINSLAINEATMSYLITLPLLHKDPFDRLLIAQSLQYDLVMATVDDAILAYPNVKFFELL
jgi:PIN domain nuclease of toxin-antitoxin system